MHLHYPLKTDLHNGTMPDLSVGMLVSRRTKTIPAQLYLGRTHEYIRSRPPKPPELRLHSHIEDKAI